ncbi:MAG: hypothetical protein KDC38_04525 [Planctomycetes bacterium]|nr:hypothetical protein [Planctomycetota bacterium]
MSSFDATIDRPGDAEMAPVHQWVEEIGTRLEGWSHSVKHISTEEWARLRAAVAGTFAKKRVEGILRDVMSRVGMRAKESELDAMVDELRMRVLDYRQGLTIENYADHWVEPPTIRV